MKIEKFNQVVWAVIGVGFILMLVFALGSVFISRFSSHRVAEVMVKPAGNSRQQLKSIRALEYYKPIVTDYSDYILIPAALKEGQEEGSSLRKVSFKYSDYGSSSMSRMAYIYHGFFWGRFNNIIFFNKGTGETRLLLDRKAVISSLFLPYEKEDEKEIPCPRFIMYGISENDNNNDGFINTEDEKVVYLSDMSGKNLVQVTPANTQMLDWTIDKRANTLYIQVRRDTNKDKRFNALDETAIIAVNTVVPGMGVEIISDKIRDRITSILNN